MYVWHENTAVRLYFRFLTQMDKHFGEEYIKHACFNWLGDMQGHVCTYMQQKI